MLFTNRQIRHLVKYGGFIQSKLIHEYNCFPEKKRCGFSWNKADRNLFRKMYCECIVI